MKRHDDAPEQAKILLSYRHSTWAVTASVRETTIPWCGMVSHVGRQGRGSITAVEERGRNIDVFT